MEHSHTFREAYCQRYGIAPERYERTLFWRSLAPAAYLLAPLVLLLRRDFFDPDRTLLHDVAGVRTVDEFGDELSNFGQHPMNKGFWRKALRVRVSGARLMKVAKKVLHA